MALFQGGNRDDACVYRTSEIECCHGLVRWFQTLETTARLPVFLQRLRALATFRGDTRYLARPRHARALSAFCACPVPGRTDRRRERPAATGGHFHRPRPRAHRQRWWDVDVG